MVLDTVGKLQPQPSVMDFVNDPKRYGSFNESPNGWEEITEEELVQRTNWLRYTPVALDYKQVIAPLGEYSEYCRSGRSNKAPALSVHLFIYHDGTGVGIHSDYWAGKMRYFRFNACEHEFVTDTQRMCYWEGHCTKCGFRNAVDSSD